MFVFIGYIAVVLQVSALRRKVDKMMDAIFEIKPGTVPSKR